MTPKQLKIEMIKNDVRPVDIARDLNVTPVAVYRVRDRQSKSKRIQRAIAERINRPVEKAFPPKKKAA
ncbi:MAG: XRE family transcriptional regulator [Desulfobacterales bacterium]|nr:XRE family transcriptional regulator [Desulfobacterales bacterium]